MTREEDELLNLPTMKIDKIKAVKSLKVLDEMQIGFDEFLVGNEWCDVHELFWFIIAELKGENNG